MMDLSNDTESGSRNRYALKIVVGLVVVGASLGLFVGLAGASALKAIGIDDSGEPPPPVKAAPAAPSASPSSEATPTDEATPEESESTSEPDKKKPDKKNKNKDKKNNKKKAAQLDASPKSASTGQRIDLKGRLPAAGSGTTLQVQRSVAGSGWEDFPVTAETRSKGKFSTWVITGRTGATKFRLVVPGTEAKTPVAKVQVG